jgi:uncharacterized protein YkwD
MRVQHLALFAAMSIGCGGSVASVDEADIDIDAVQEAENPDLAAMEAAIEGSFLATQEETHLDRINNHRNNHVGARSTPMRACLRESARRHSRNMANAGRIYHRDMSNLMSRLNADCAGGTVVGVGENVGRGGSELSLFNAFLASSTHHAVIDRSYWNNAGVGIFRDSSGTFWITHVFAKFQ